MKGSIDVHAVESAVLAGNPLGDPTHREVWVYVPSGIKRSESLPTILYLTGFMSTGPAIFNLDPLAENLAQRLDRLIGAGECPPVRVVAPDYFTRLGGNQYINSSAVGRYEDFLIQEVVPFIEKTYAVRGWAVMGKSSGGYGAIVLGMRNPDVFSALADHSGDSNFELCYLPDARNALNAFRDAGGPARWLERFWADENRKRSKHGEPLVYLSMAASYSPNPASPHLGVDFPHDLETGEFRPDVWDRWRAWDPVQMVAAHAEGLRRMKLIYVDCGTRDEFALQWGARALAARLRQHGVAVDHREFDDGHMNVQYRCNTSIPLLGKALAG